MTFERGAAVRVRQYPGVAWRVDGPQVEYREPECPEWIEDDEDYDAWCAGLEPEDWDEVETGMLRLHMVGDDREWIIDPSDVEELPEEDYCPSCGQIGCGWGH